MTCKQSVKARFLIYIMGLLITFGATAAHAQNFTRLTDSNIEDFIRKTTEMTSGTHLTLNAEEIQDYLEKHLHDKARFKSTVRYNIPGFPASSNALSFNKEEFMENVAEGANSISDYENEIEILDIKISSDKTKATVKTRGLETGTMPVANNGKTQFVPINGESSCAQILTLNDGYIQMYNANCTTIITFSGL